MGGKEGLRNVEGDVSDCEAAMGGKAKEQKDAFEKFKATDAGQKALEDKEAERAEAKEAKDKKNAKKAAKAVEKDEKLKKPASAYFISPMRSERRCRNYSALKTWAQ